MRTESHCNLLYFKGKVYQLLSGPLCTISYLQKDHKAGGISFLSFIQFSLYRPSKKKERVCNNLHLGLLQKNIAFSFPFNLSGRVYSVELYVRHLIKRSNSFS